MYALYYDIRFSRKRKQPQIRLLKRSPLGARIGSTRRCQMRSSLSLRPQIRLRRLRLVLLFVVFILCGIPELTGNFARSMARNRTSVIFMDSYHLFVYSFVFFGLVVFSLHTCDLSMYDLHYKGGFTLCVIIRITSHGLSPVPRCVEGHLREKARPW